jgi:hypothetical protein
MFFVHLFKLSMRYMDLMDAFSGSQQSQEESVQDFFLNCGNLMDELKEHEEKVHEVLQYIGAEYQIRPLTECVSAGVCITAATCGAASHACSKTIEFFQWCSTGAEGNYQEDSAKKDQIFPVSPLPKLPPSIGGRTFRMLAPPPSKETDHLEG